MSNGQRPTRPARKRTLCLVIALLIAVYASPLVWTRVTAQEKNSKSDRLVFMAYIQNVGGGVGGVQNTPVTIYINEFSPPQEVMELVEMLRNRGPQPVVNKLALMEKGRFSPVGRVGTNLAVIRSFNTEKGRIIRAVASRPQGFRELYGSTRSTDYPFGVLELRLDKNGKGEGSLIMAAKINFDKDGMLQMESFDQGNIRLVNVKLQ